MSASYAPQAALRGQLAASLDARTLELLDRRREHRVPRRGWLLRRLLALADVVGLCTAFLLAEAAFGTGGGPVDGVGFLTELFVFALTLPGWIVAAKLYGLYNRDEERTDHSTLDEFAGVFNVVTIGTWIVFTTAWLTNLADPNPGRMVVFWGAAIACVVGGRGLARTLSRRSVSYLQNTLIVGAGDIGQLIARKYLQHPEYGINLVGFVDDDPRERRPDLGHVALLGGSDDLPEIVDALDIERVVVAFSNESQEDVVELVRSLKDSDVQVDIVPRLFELLSPNVGIHTVEGLPLVGLPPVRIGRSSRALKRMIDVIGALLGLVLTAPIFAVAALAIRRESPGPVFFRQVRLGVNTEPFTLLKFRTMKVGTPDDLHREYVRASMRAGALPESNGLYKLERNDSVTRVGKWLRRTSLDELPQLLNVLRGDMSLVGPRPCLDYETADFAPHHFERFNVPAGITGLWQVTARAHATFGEALDMDVAYVRGWSLGLDVWLLFRTPLQLLRGMGTR